MGLHGNAPTREQASAQLDTSLTLLLTLQASVEADAALAARLTSVQAWQTRRLAQTYADQREQYVRRDAVAFFLNDVYGPRDFALRDRQFQRALRPLKAMLPADALTGLSEAVQMQALSLDLDLAMARMLDTPVPLSDEGYAAAYRKVQRIEDRRRQIELVGAIGARLVSLVRHPGVELALRLAARPARMAGFGDLQTFLEHGFAAFQRMGGAAADFIATIQRRETEFMDSMLSRPTDPPPGP
jgi:hypothetical protein